tara:strand:- start:73 stop:351 length:279 start_codon:yes stop_codon:yes gene_type:complete
MAIQGNTPFELAERRRQEGIARLEIAVNTQKIVDYIRECDEQIKYYIGLAAIGESTSEERALAREARKDKAEYEKALDALVKITCSLLGDEA